MALVRRHPIGELGPWVLHFIAIDSVGDGEVNGTRRSGGRILWK